MRQYLIILTTLVALIAWSSPASARDNHRSHKSAPHHDSQYYKHSRKHYKKSRKYYRQSPRHAYRDNNYDRSRPHKNYSRSRPHKNYSRSRPHNNYGRSRPHKNYGFRVDGHYGYYNNQRFYRNQHHGSSYYYNSGGYYFPSYGYIANGHHHDRYCPVWHANALVTGVLLGVLLGS
ncbi:MAG: hypothetical protein L3J24_15010 [Xanthomonadales bacterium]|nr:hypothetical protein [Xanthomonadales bacterium]